ncbi:histidine--tRNA ligase [Sulfolobus sp. A20]|uniref:histidine--tRNA ligase n=1 Tax=Sulfolobaceae TaxID=118883 RepID=UPI000845DA81|nr:MULTISPECIES: histidine--tRNA ligase [unclassified Sulfolobus]TRM77777.1 histidine--tRNA ligase [Sulfolobus sp. A20-N-F8]TRM83912.1 histidine--tRNA ligase [Sulfolobus sp. A20-N-F6]TRM88709.1 histidine--tRNA ligase [Sulfolobus sp. C3]TRM94756.1 histidine--tRNA ligase [Sulfolobus sp. A20-N-G8]TRN00092.1 histidine--tRNA ligase [Sulfolobus sp. F1]TRN03099.1 histidine--tRNA ligase [Sulfolobus sp. E1]
MPKFETVRGMKDYIDSEARKIRYIETIFRNLVEKYGYSEIISPVLEDFKLFALKGGEELRETMYVFKDKAGREVALRPEFTPSVARAYVESLQSMPKPVRVYYFGTVYRYDEPQYGRYREFRQAGVELIGDNSILSDIEIIDLLYNFYDKINISQNINMKLNNIAIFRRLMSYYGLEDNIQEHLLHLIDKGKKDEAIDLLTHYIKEGDNTINLINNLLNIKGIDSNELRDVIEGLRRDFREFKIIEEDVKYLQRIADLLSALNFNFKIDLGFVRGLAYYTGIIFEVTHPSVTFSIAGGGRYDKLIELYGGIPTPAIGFAIGVERTLLVINLTNLQESNKIVIINLTDSDKLLAYSVKVASLLRSEGYTVVLNMKNQPLSKLIPYYASQNFKIAIIIGENEFEKRTVTLRNLITKTQVTTSIDRLLESLKQML